MRGRRAVVVGGGAAAARVATDLITAEADVLVVAPVLNEVLADLAARGLITAVTRNAVAADLDDAWLVLACAGQPGVNAAIAGEAERNRIWCVTAGDDESSSALLPAPDGTDSQTVPTAAAAAGETAAAGQTAVAGPRPGRRVLVLGGARSGKSATAEAMLARAAAVDYVATGHRPGDGDQEWDQRVLAHRDRRPGHWTTIETLDVEAVLSGPDLASAVLVDCISTWLARVMDDCGIWAEAQHAESGLARRIDGLIEAWQLTRRHAVAVSNEVGSGIVPATHSGRRFRDELGWLNSRIAAASDEVWLCTAGIARQLR
jgi:adenosylcobinamide kinase/adenosylcobinamide-phosphate guanylyltransferase